MFYNGLTKFLMIIQFQAWDLTWISNRSKTNIKSIETNCKYFKIMFLTINFEVLHSKWQNQMLNSHYLRSLQCSFPSMSFAIVHISRDGRGSHYQINFLEQLTPVCIPMRLTIPIGRCTWPIRQRGLSGFQGCFHRVLFECQFELHGGKWFIRLTLCLYSNP